MQVGISEFLEKVTKLKTKEEKIAALKANDSLPLRIILQGAFDYNVVWLLPEGEPPPYKPNELVDQEHILVGECEKLRYFVKGFHDNLNQKKRESMFVEFLERVDKNDAAMLCEIINHKLPSYGMSFKYKITKKMVKEAFPDMFPNEIVKEEEEESNNVEV